MRFLPRLLTLAVAPALLFLLGAGCDPFALNGGSCMLGGTVYPDGASGIKAPDGCNTCSCAHGELACTTIGCPLSGQVCGGLQGLTCPAGSYCNFPSDARCGAAATGICTATPSACPQRFAPVCGCDGKTYDNACLAAAAKTSVTDASACTAPSGPCVVNGVSYPDGSANIPSPDDGCNTCECQNGALSCTIVLCSDPNACSRGGVSYPNGATNIPAGDGCNTCSCSDGDLSCTTVACANPKPCGGFAGFTCSATEYCSYVAGQLCGAADASATCLPRPAACTADVRPVCGCDGNTYSNACVAAQAGFGYSSTGPCSN